MVEESGVFAEDKDVAAVLRTKVIGPSLSRNHKVAIDFDEVTLTTQSFVHALISKPVRDLGERSLDLLLFKNCSALVQGLIETVVQYSLEAVELAEEP